MRPTLNAREDAVLRALAGANGPWADASHVSRAAHLRARRTLDRLCGKGLIERWIGDGNGHTFKTPRYTFTPLGAYVLDVRLDEERDGSPRWFAGLEARLDRPLRSRWAGHLPLNLPDTIADPRKGPIEYLIDMESHETTTDPAEAAKLWNVPIPRVVKPRARRR